MTTVGYHSIDGMGIRVSGYVEKVTRKHVTFIYETIYNVKVFTHKEWRAKKPIKVVTII